MTICASETISAAMESTFLRGNWELSDRVHDLQPNLACDRKFSNYLSKRRWRVAREIMACKINRIGSRSFSLRSKRSEKSFCATRGRVRRWKRKGNDMFLSFSGAPEGSTCRVNQSRGKQAYDQLAW